ncbi:TIGR04282 family arsenosugar biosynthesis glycosyltransferase [Rhodopila sp.]|uniref:TIGR04282 family arsenosugar biosynthesis glycosyltransferase n=1 Tax=Rhodopila sp. TaxID=2480087 RepID=UPI003D09F8CE
MGCTFKIAAAQIAAAQTEAAETVAARTEAACCAIGVMAKAPRAGFSKTRLCPPLQPDQAALLSAAFLRDITENIAQAARHAKLAGFVAYAPEGQEALFEGHLAAGTGLLLADGSPLMPPDVRGFGRCLLHAILAMLARGHDAAVVLNSDSPTLPTAVLVRTAAALAAPGDRIVIGPAEDGGYYLLGMKAPHAHLFAEIAWSTESVAQTTRTRAAQLGLEVVELPVWYDVDDQAALARLLGDTTTQEMCNGLLPYAAPFTAAALKRMTLREQGVDFAAE